MAKIKLLGLSVGIIGLTGLAAAWLGVLPGRDVPTAAIRSSQKVSDSPLGRMVRLDGGTFRMGNDFSDQWDASPAHDVTVSPFWMDEHEVTNRQFAQFVDQTGYITTAQERGWSHVFDRRAGSWRKCPGADWRHPGGPETTLDGRDDYPVVHISCHDATAYARWAGKQLPTEAQWEYAARAGLRDADYPWGRDERPDGRYEANYWQGWYPEEDLAMDGHDELARVRSYRPNEFGLFDVSGNVWEWCGDFYDASYYAESPSRDPTGPLEGTSRVLRGGSWLSSENHGSSYRVFTRAHREPDATYEDIGLRCVRGATAGLSSSVSPGN